MVPSPARSSRGEGNRIRGAHTQGGARSSLAVGYYQVIPTGFRTLIEIDGGPDSSAWPEPHQQSLRRLNQNFPQQLFHASRFRLTQSPAQPQARRINDSSASEKHRETIPAYAEPMRLSGSNRIDQQ